MTILKAQTVNVYGKDITVELKSVARNLVCSYFIYIQEQLIDTFTTESAALSKFDNIIARYNAM